MRVVVLEPHAENRDALQRTILECPGFQLVGVSQTWSQCEHLLNLYVPELLIARIDVAASNLAENAGDSILPVIFGLRTKGDRRGHNVFFATLELPLNAKTFSIAMENARTEIYRRKLEEIFLLLQRYTNFSPGLPQYLESPAIENGEGLEIPAELVIFLAADGNYVRVHTMADVHEIRDTLSGMKSRLDPALFTRVHRSFVVNRNHVRSVMRKEGTTLCVLLSNGAEIPVGPNYKAEVDSFETVTKRLIA